MVDSMLPKKSLVFCWLLLVLATATALSQQKDTDGDGLLDVLDVDGFNPNASGTIKFVDLGIEDLDGVDQLRRTPRLDLAANAITSIESGDFDGLINLAELFLSDNAITSIESGAFARLTNLRFIDFGNNELSELNFAGVTLNQRQTALIDENIASLVLDDATLSVGSFDTILGETTYINDASLAGLTFSDSNPTDLNTLFAIGPLDNIWVDQTLFDAYADEINAFGAKDGNTVTVVPLGAVTKTCH